MPYAVLAVVVCVVAQLPQTNDAAWQLWIGRELVRGAELYHDIIEINPPLWFWLAVPLVQAAGFLGISGNFALIGFLGLSAALSIAMVQRMNPNPWILLSLVFAFFVPGLSETGQREQFTLIAFMPCVFLAAARAERKGVRIRFAILVGLWAGLGIALKHYFVLAPLALELWLVLKRRWAIRPELIALCATGLVYVAIIYVVTPAYLHSVVPMIQESYGSFNSPFGSLLSSEILSVAAIALLGLALLPERSATVQSLGVAGLAFLVAFLLQRKGFHYQGLPAVGLFSAMAIVALATKTRWDFRSKSAAFALGLVPLLAVATTSGHASRPHRPTLALFCDLPRGSTVLVLTPYGDVAWPAIEICGQRWASRYMFLWMLHAINRDPDRHGALAKNLHRHIALDIARYRPDLIIVERGRDRFGIDPLAFVMSDPTLRSQLADNYDRSLIPKRAIFRMKSAGQPPQAN